MKKIEQLILELQTLVHFRLGNHDLDKVIDEKLWDAWRDANAECNQEWIKRHDAYWDNYKKWITPEELTKMAKSHHFQLTSDYGDEETCYKCLIEIDDFDREPQYCTFKEKV